MDNKGRRRSKPAGLLMRTPRLTVSCKSVAPGCCAVQRDSAWRKFRRHNRDYCRKEALLELDAPAAMA